MIPTGMSEHRAKVSTRIIAKVIDLLFMLILAAVLPRYVGPLFGFFYSICADGFDFGPFHGQSVGKKIMKLQVRNIVRDQPGNFRDSLIRNAPVGVATFFAIIPFVGWVIFTLVGIPLAALEIALMIRIPESRRLGDAMADTQVVEYKNVEKTASA